MAARLTRGTAKIPWDTSARSRVQTTMLIKRLQDLAYGNIEMPPHAVTAALGLLKKTLPDLATVTHEGGHQPVRLEISWTAEPKE